MSVPNVSLSRFAPPSLQRQVPGFPNANLTPATAFTPAANGVAANPGLQPTTLSQALTGRMPFFRPAGMQNTTMQIGTVSFSRNQQQQQQQQQGILQRLAETVQPPAQPLPVQPAAELQLPTASPALPDASDAQAAAKTAEKAAPTPDVKPASQNLHEAANGIPEGAVKGKAAEAVEAQAAQQTSKPTEAKGGRGGPSLTEKPPIEATPSSANGDNAAEATSPAEIALPSNNPASKKWTGLREAKSLASAIQENSGLQLPGQ